ncbi:unnamed protein product [Cercopithifilaria johnstoni]|uniref:Fatty-acid and retinol-binding protein 1 n=1 Tax=Cercopithifilaria johnstoni TaxID=2874296 RepID=A0A8J2Q6J4_9BILA|nr:unnamed protein product [Cercopithifilaria johnstoni]
MIMKFFLGVIFCISKIALELHAIPAHHHHRTAKTENADQDKFSWYTFADSIQNELKTFYSNLNDEEKIQLIKLAQTSAEKFSLTDNEFLDSLKNEAGGLFGKLTGLKDLINEKLNTMQPESRLFIENLLRRFLAIFSQDSLTNILKALKDFGKEIIEMFDGLSKPIQDDIRKAFPTLGTLASNDIVRFILQKLAELNLFSTFDLITDQTNKDSGKLYPSSQITDGKDELSPTQGRSLVDDEEVSVKKVIVVK